MFGGPLRAPVPDVDRTHWFLVVGANPMVSNGSLMTAPGMRERLAALRARGGKLVVIDPRRSETAAVADEHHFIAPGGDAAFLLGMIHVLFAEGRVALGACEGIANGLADVEAIAARFAPERVAERCGIPAPVIERLAREMAEAPSAAAYGRMGTCVQRFRDARLVGARRALHLDRQPRPPGRGDVREPGRAAVPGARAGRPGALRPLAEPRVGPATRSLGEVPVMALAEEIDAGEGQVARSSRWRATRCAPRRTAAGSSARWRRSTSSSSLDWYLNETTRHAHLILPPTGPLRARALRPRAQPLRGAQRRALVAAGARRRAGDARRVDHRDRARTAHHEHRFGGARAVRRARAAPVRAARTRREPLEGRGDDRRGDGGRGRGARAGAHPRRADPPRSLRRRVRQPSGWAHARAREASRARARPSGRSSPCCRATCTPRAGRSSSRPSASSRISRASKRGSPRTRAAPPGEPAHPALDELVDAQPRAPREGQGPLHAPDPPRGRVKPRASAPDSATARMPRASARSAVPIEVTDTGVRAASSRSRTASVTTAPASRCASRPGSPASTSTPSPTTSPSTSRAARACSSAAPSRWTGFKKRTDFFFKKLSRGHEHARPPQSFLKKSSSFLKPSRDQDRAGRPSSPSTRRGRGALRARCRAPSRTRGR